MLECCLVAPMTHGASIRLPSTSWTKRSASQLRARVLMLPKATRTFMSFRVRIRSKARPFRSRHTMLTRE